MKSVHDPLLQWLCCIYSQDLRTSRLNEYSANPTQVTTHYYWITNAHPKKNKQQQPCSVHRVSSAETAIAAITLANLQSLTVTNQRETPSHLFSCWLRTRAEEVPSRTSGVGEHLAQAYIQNDTLGNSISEEHLKKRRLHGFIIHVVPKAQNTTSRTCTNFAF